jgi:hypothetical protein
MGKPNNMAVFCVAVTPFALYNHALHSLNIALPSRIDMAMTLQVKYLSWS